MAIYGSFTIRLDSGRRFALPSRVKMLLPPDLLIMKHSQEPCLMVHSENSWNDYQTPETATFIQQVSTKDKYIILASQLVAYASLKPDDQAIILGMVDHLELWNVDVWENTISCVPGSLFNHKILYF